MSRDPIMGSAVLLGDAPSCTGHTFADNVNVRIGGGDHELALVVAAEIASLRRGRAFSAELIHLAVAERNVAVDLLGEFVALNVIDRLPPGDFPGGPELMARARALVEEVNALRQGCRVDAVEA